MRAGRYLYGVHIFCIAWYFLVIECRRFDVISDSMKLDRIRLEILKKDKESVVLSVQNICRMWGLCDFYFILFICIYIFWKKFIMKNLRDMN